MEKRLQKLIVSLDDRCMVDNASMNEAVVHLKEKGFQIEEVMQAIGSIRGLAPADSKEEIAGLPMVISVHAEGQKSAI